MAQKPRLASAVDIANVARESLLSLGFSQIRLLSRCFLHRPTGQIGSAITIAFCLSFGVIDLLGSEALVRAINRLVHREV